MSSEERFNEELNARTNADKLAKCKIDLRDSRIDRCQGPSAVPELFVITIIYNNENYDA
jgi:hypothetical protein